MRSVWFFLFLKFIYFYCMCVHTCVISVCGGQNTTFRSQLSLLCCKVFFAVSAILCMAGILTQDEVPSDSLVSIPVSMNAGTIDVYYIQPLIYLL